MRFTEKIAVITGGSQGIGATIARRLSLEGATVAVIASKDRAKAESVAAEITAAGGRADAYAADVRDGHAIRKVIDEVAARFGRLDLLVNSAGLFFPTPIGGTPASDIDRLVDVNLKGPFNAINAAAPHMKGAGFGKIVNIASVAGIIGVGGYSLYSATKAGVIHMTRALALELAPAGVNINAIAPGNTATPMNENIRTDPSLKPMLEAMAARTPSGKVFSEPDDIAGLALYLLSDDARAMHGSTVLMDEGISAGI